MIERENEIIWKVGIFRIRERRNKLKETKFCCLFFFIAACIDSRVSHLSLNKKLLEAKIRAFQIHSEETKIKHVFNRKEYPGKKQEWKFKSYALKISTNGERERGI